MFILASGSPRRKEILAMLGYQYVVQPADADESIPQGLSPAEIVSLLSRRKAEAVSADHPGDIVLGADTLVFLGNQILGKPKDREDARKMLSLLSGNTHEVWTGVTVTDGSRLKTIATSSSVTFHELSEETIERYLATGEPNDKAGAYAIQGRGSILIRDFHGDFFSTIGLPASATASLLDEFCVFPEGQK